MLLVLRVRGAGVLERELRARLVGGERGVHGHREQDLTLELGAEGVDHLGAQALLQDFLGVLVRHRDQGGRVDEPHEPGQAQERTLLGVEPGVPERCNRALPMRARSGSVTCTLWPLSIQHRRRS